MAGSVPKDLYAWQANGSPDRLTRPLVRRGGRQVETDWDDALGRVAERIKELLDEHGPSSIGVYTTGQLFLEEYYTLGVIARGGIGTAHLDGNTRLCTATAAAALKESFGCDGQPGSYEDVDHADVIALWGHNVAETQTVLWMRMLDRLAGPNPPRLLCVDPRRTQVAAHATIHLAPRPGTNLVLLNALLHEILRNGWYDESYVEAHAVGLGDLQQTVKAYPPERAEEICDVPADQVRAAAELIGTTDRLLSTVLQGVYQSHQATATAVQINNIHILRGMLGLPGAGILQMNGQPSAENTREAGANGDLAGFRNWANEEHVKELARLWDVPLHQIPHWAPPTHAMQIMRYAEQGSIRLLWIIGTNPAVSLPELARIRSILGKDDLFVVAQDIFPTETTELADVVLPAATWAEKTGTFTNADRTVHLSEQAVDPPGDARADLAIFVDLASRLDLRNQSGEPLIGWADSQGAFEAWKACSKGRPCDYSAMSYDLLRGGSGVQWPCTDEHPEGTPRLYEGGSFFAAPDTCEDYGHDLLTGAPAEPVEYKALNPSGKAMIKAAHYRPPAEQPDDEHPYTLITGRTVYHFHTRTKTGRSPELQEAAPEVWVEMAAADAAESGWDEGDLLEVQTPRGSVRARLRISGIRSGVLFVPFHYGYWDRDPHSANGDDQPRDRAANELTITTWDPVSKQPIFKTAAAKVSRIALTDGQSSPAPDVGGSAMLGASTAENSDPGKLR